jgi:hypothetical protein
MLRSFLTFLFLLNYCFARFFVRLRIQSFGNTTARYELIRAHEHTNLRPNTPISIRPTRLAWSEKPQFRIPHIYAHCLASLRLRSLLFFFCSEQWIFEVFSGYVAGNSNRIALSIVVYHLIILIPTFVCFKEYEFYPLKHRVISLRYIFQLKVHLKGTSEQCHKVRKSSFSLIVTYRIAKTGS